MQMLASDVCTFSAILRTWLVLWYMKYNLAWFQCIAQSDVMPVLWIQLTNLLTWQSEMRLETWLEIASWFHLGLERLDKVPKPKIKNDIFKSMLWINYSFSPTNNLLSAHQASIFISKFKARPVRQPISLHQARTKLKGLSFPDNRSSSPAHKDSSLCLQRFATTKGLQHVEPVDHEHQVQKQLKKCFTIWSCTKQIPRQGQSELI